MTHSIHFHRTMLHIASEHSRYSFFSLVIFIHTTLTPTDCMLRSPIIRSCFLVQREVNYVCRCAHSSAWRRKNETIIRAIYVPSLFSNETIVSHIYFYDATSFGTCSSTAMQTKTVCKSQTLLLHRARRYLLRKKYSPCVCVCASACIQCSQPKISRNIEQISAIIVRILLFRCGSEWARILLMFVHRRNGLSAEDVSRNPTATRWCLQMHGHCVPYDENVMPTHPLHSRVWVCECTNAEQRLLPANIGHPILLYKFTHTRPRIKSRIIRFSCGARTPHRSLVEAATIGTNEPYLLWRWAELRITSIYIAPLLLSFWLFYPLCARFWLNRLKVEKIT